VGTKHFLLTLYECGRCGLKYRYPKDEERSATRFYELSYREKSVVDVPTDEELVEVVERRFVGTKFDKSDKVRLIERYVPREASVLDFGASFGYMLLQLEHAGYTRVLGYELSPTRARIAREKVGVPVASTLSAVEQSALSPYGCVYAAHVLEHLPHIRTIFAWLRSLMCAKGYLILWTPNATQAALDTWHGGTWTPLVGEPHTMALDYPFLRRAIPPAGFEIVAEGEAAAEELWLIARAL
jgi:hypothetical protein